MLIKVCGLRQKDNILKIKDLTLDYMGLIFYEKSPRFVEKEPQDSIQLSSDFPFVGVFVNADIDYILSKIKQYHLVAVQLHGNETVEFIQNLHKKIQFLQLNIQIFKAFGINENFDFQSLIPYETFCDLFVFDTQTPMHGGSGQQYNWQILDNYFGQTPFLLSGGIGLEDVERVKKLEHPQFGGVDLNSRFEISPALKNVAMLSDFITILRQ